MPIPIETSSVFYDAFRDCQDWGASYVHGATEGWRTAAGLATAPPPHRYVPRAGLLAFYSSVEDMQMAQEVSALFSTASVQRREIEWSLQRTPLATLYQAAHGLRGNSSHIRRAIRERAVTWEMYLSLSAHLKAMGIQTECPPRLKYALTLHDAAATIHAFVIGNFKLPRIWEVAVIEQTLCHPGELLGPWLKFSTSSGGDLEEVLDDEEFQVLVARMVRAGLTIVEGDTQLERRFHEVLVGSVYEQAAWLAELWKPLTQEAVLLAVDCLKEASDPDECLLQVHNSRVE